MESVQRLIGLVNYVTRFIENPADICQPVCQLTHKDADCFWSEAHENPFKWIKQVVTQALVLRYFNPAQETCFIAMHQTLVLEPHSFKMATQWHMRDSLDTKRNYALIKKELLAIKFGAEKFNQ